MISDLLPDGQITRGSKFLSSPVEKNIWLSPSGKSNLPLAPSCSERGALRNVTKRGAGCGGRGHAADEQHLMRTAKSCGPDASMLASSCERCLAYDGDNQARSPGRARYRLLKPLRAGMPGVSGEPRGDYARVVLFFSTRGCGCIAHPAFPTPSVILGERFMHHSGVEPPRDRGGVFLSLLREAWGGWLAEREAVSETGGGLCREVETPPP